MFRRKQKLKEGVYVFSTKPDGKYKKFLFGVVTGVDGNKVGVNGLIIDPVGLKNKVEQGKAGPRSVDILKNPHPESVIMGLIYRTEHDNFTDVLDLDKEQLLVIPPKVYEVLNGWIRESIPELINNVLSLPPGTERDEAKRVLRQRMDTLNDKTLKKNLYSVCRSLKILF
jgi:hypothetical protein